MLENGRFPVHIRRMGQFLPEPLTEAEFAALKQIVASSPFCSVEPQTRERLISMGYAKEILGSLIVTAEGLMLIEMGR